MIWWKCLQIGDFPHKYGIQRLWGSVGWGLCAPFVGFLIDYYSIGKTDKDFTPLFYLVAVLLVFDLFIATSLKVSLFIFFINSYFNL